MARERILLALAGAWLMACTGDEDPVGGPGPGPSPDEGGDLVRPADEAAPFAEGVEGKQPNLVCSAVTKSHALAPADSRDFSNASLALAELLRGSWPAPASSAELLAFLGPHRGPKEGRLLGHLTGSRLDAFYLAPAAPQPVHVIAVLDLGPSIRTEVPLVTGALDAFASRIASSGLSDELSVVEWTEEASVGVRLASASDAVARVASFNDALRARVQFGGNPPMSVVREGVLALADEGQAPAHVVLLTDGSLSAKEASTADTIAAWRGAGVAISLVEVQGFEPEQPLDALPIHASLLDDRRIADAGFYVAGAVVGDPARPPARSVDPAYRWQIDYLFSERFDDLFRPSTVRARFDLSVPEEVDLKPLLVSESDDGQTGVRRLGSTGVAFTQANVSTQVCSSFEGTVRLLGQSLPEGSDEVITTGTVLFGGAELPAYQALFTAIDEIERALGSKSCDASAVVELADALIAAPTVELDESESAAFQVSRDRTLLALGALEALCN